MALLEVKNLTKKFGGLTAVDAVSFKIESNKIMGLIGPNGAGKTTVFNLITGVYKITSGSIMFNDRNIHNVETYKIATAGITRTFQNIRLFKKQTVYDNILTACHNNSKYTLAEAIMFGAMPKNLVVNTRFAREEVQLRDEAEELMKIMGLTNRKDFVANNLPYGLQRRLEIARALAARPKLLLLDEPAAGMNPDETDKLMELIGEIRNKFKISILLIEHHMDLIMGICDDITVLNFGCVIADGNPFEIQNNSKVKLAYLGGE